MGLRFLSAGLPRGRQSFIPVRESHTKLIFQENTNLFGHLAENRSVIWRDFVRSFGVKPCPVVAPDAKSSAPDAKSRHEKFFKVLIIFQSRHSVSSRAHPDGLLENCAVIL